MAQIKSGIRKILEFPFVYTTFQNLIGGKYARDYFVNNYVRPEDGMKILDIGCGPADILHHIHKKIEYVGFDFEPAYIEKARRQFPHNTTFYCEDLTTFNFKSTDKFDRIIMSEIQHHLEDDIILNIFNISKNLLKEDGYIVSFENAYTDDQNFIARKLIDLDRGQNVRTAEGYEKLGKQVFKDVTYEINHHLLNIPYTNIMLKYSHPL